MYLYMNKYCGINNSTQTLSAQKKASRYALTPFFNNNNKKKKREKRNSTKTHGLKDVRLNLMFVRCITAVFHTHTHRHTHAHIPMRDCHYHHGSVIVVVMLYVRSVFSLSYTRKVVAHFYPTHHICRCCICIKKKCEKPLHCVYWPIYTYYIHPSIHPIHSWYQRSFFFYLFINEFTEQ